MMMMMMMMTLGGAVLSDAPDNTCYKNDPAPVRAEHKMTDFVTVA